MKRTSLNIKLDRPSSHYDIVIGDGLLAAAGKWARGCVGNGAGCIAVVSNPTVFELYGRTVVDSLSSAGFIVSTFSMKDGERFKNIASAEDALTSFSDANLARTDAVVALGGGVVGDLAGFAASIYMRGIACLQVPTTLLAMIDSSTGGKTGVNTASGKNLIGSFAQPGGVLIDVDVLRTLPRRELTAGFCEAVKQGAIGGKALLNETDTLLSAFPVHQFAKYLDQPNFRSQISNLISAHIAFKAQIVANDEKESPNRRDARSRKVLNFGHTFAHALEKVTNYKHFRHGEAVGYGILFAAELSKSLALCPEKDVRLLYDVVHRAGPLPSIADIDAKRVFDAFRTDKKNIAGTLQMVLLKGIGKPVIVPQSDIPRPAMRKALEKLLQKTA
jgi:3-dehydroquinate synthase